MQHYIYLMGRIDKRTKTLRSATLYTPNGEVDKRITVQRSAVAYIPDGEDWHSSWTGAGDNRTSGESLDCWLHDDKDSTIRAGGDSDLSFFTLHQDRFDNDNGIYLLQAAKPLSLPTQDKNTGNPMQTFFVKLGQIDMKTIFRPLWNCHSITHCKMGGRWAKVNTDCQPRSNL